MSLENHKYLCNKFIDFSQIPYNEDGEIYGTVYCIENILSGKRYIGSTINFSRRVSEYIRTNQDPDYYFDKMRIIDKAMLNEGIHNFSIYPIRNCNCELNLAYWELYYIKEYNTMNTTARVKSRPKYKPYPKGIKPSANNRKKRSRPIIAINLESKTVYLSDSIKLLAHEIFHSDRAIVSHAALLGQKIYGYYIYYVDKLSTTTMVENKISTYIRNIGKRSGCIDGRDKEYAELGDIIIEERIDFFYRNNFQIYTLEYSDEVPERFILNKLQ